MITAVRNAIEALRSAGRTAKDKQLSKRFTDELKSRLNAVLVGSVSATSINLLRDSFVVDIQPFYASQTELALNLVAVVIDDVYSTRLGPCLSVANQSPVVQHERGLWERLIDDGLIAGLQEYVDSERYDSKIFADKLYDILCRMMTDETAHAIGLQLRRQICATISDSIKCRDYNRSVLLAPEHLGGPRLGDLVVSNNSYLVLEPLLELMARLLPPQRSNKARTAILKGCFGSPSVHTAFPVELLNKLGKIFLKASPDNWEETAQSMFALIAESDIRRPQPLHVSRMTVWTIEHTTPMPLYVDNDAFVVSVQHKEDDSLSIMNIPFSTVTRVTIREAQKDGIARITCKTTAPPLLQAHPLSQQQPESAKIVVFEIPTGEVGLFKRAMEARGMTKTMAERDPQKISSSAAIPLAVNWQSGSRILIPRQGLNQRREQLASLARSTPSDPASRMSGPAKDSEGREHDSSGADGSDNPQDPVATAVRTGPNVAGASSDGHSILPKNPSTSLRKGPEHIPSTRSATLMKAIFGDNSDEELSDIETIPTASNPLVVAPICDVSHEQEPQERFQAVSPLKTETTPIDVSRRAFEDAPATRTRGRRSLKGLDKRLLLSSVERSQTTKRKRDTHLPLDTSRAIEDAGPLRPSKKAKRGRGGPRATDPNAATKASSESQIAPLNVVGLHRGSLQEKTSSSPVEAASPLEIVPRESGATQSNNPQQQTMRATALTSNVAVVHDEPEEPISLRVAGRRRQIGPIALSEASAGDHVSESGGASFDEPERQPNTELLEIKDSAWDDSTGAATHPSSGSVTPIVPSDVKKVRYAPSNTLNLPEEPKHREHGRRLKGPWQTEDFLRGVVHESDNILDPGPDTAMMPPRGEEQPESVTLFKTMDKIAAIPNPIAAPDFEFQFEELGSDHSVTRASLSPEKPVFINTFSPTQTFPAPTTNSPEPIATYMNNRGTSKEAALSRPSHVLRSVMTIHHLETPRIPLQELPTADFAAASKGKQKLDAARDRLDLLSERKARLIEEEAHRQHIEPRYDDDSTDGEVINGPEERPAIIAIIATLDAIRDVILSNLNNKVAYVRSNVRVARAKIMADARADLTILTRQKQQQFSTFADISEAYERFSVDLGTAYEQLDRCDDCITQTLHKTVKRHDKYSLITKLPSALFLGSR